jgi:hypothetical protein
MSSKTLHNSNASGASKNVKDIVFWGDGDTFKLISKASSVNEGWMKSTKAMEIEGVGVVIQVTTQQRGVQEKRFLSTRELTEKYGEENRPTWEDQIETDWSIAEALTFVPGSKIEEVRDDYGVVTSRKIVKI